MWSSFFYNYGKMEITKNEGTQNTIPNQLFHNGVNQTWKSFTIHVGCLYQPISGTATMIHFLSKTRRMALQWESQVVFYATWGLFLGICPACNVRLLRVWLFLTCWTRCGFQRVCGVGETWLQNKHGVDVFVKKLVTCQNRGPPPWRCAICFENFVKSP